MVFISIFVPSILKLRVKHPQFSATGAWEIKNERWSTARSFGTDHCSKKYFNMKLYQITVLSSFLSRNLSIHHQRRVNQRRLFIKRDRSSKQICHSRRWLVEGDRSSKEIVCQKRLFVKGDQKEIIQRRSE